MSFKTVLSKDTKIHTGQSQFCVAKAKKGSELSMMSSVWNMIQIHANLREKNMNLDAL